MSLRSILASEGIITASFFQDWKTDPRFPGTHTVQTALGTYTFHEDEGVITFTPSRSNKTTPPEEGRVKSHGEAKSWARKHFDSYSDASYKGDGGVKPLLDELQQELQMTMGARYEQVQYSEDSGALWGKANVDRHNGDKLRRRLHLIDRRTSIKLLPPPPFPEQGTSGEYIVRGTSDGNRVELVFSFDARSFRILTVTVNP